MKTQNLPILILVVLAGSLLNSCEELGFGCIRGNGDLTTEGRLVSDFDGIEVNGSFTVYIDSSNETNVLVEADENLLDEIKTQVRGNQLVIETYHDRCLDSRNDITIYVTTPEIENMELRGSGDIFCDHFESSDLNVKLSGSGTIHLDYISSDDSYFDLSGSGTIRGTVDTYSADILVTGSGVVRLDGNAHHADMDLTGSGSILAREFYCETADVEVTGSGNIEVFATDFLEAKVTGSGTVYYYGDPVNVVKEITGSGNIIKR